MEGTLRRSHQLLHRLAQVELLAADLIGYGNLHEQWAYALRATCGHLEKQGVPHELLVQVPITIPPVPDLWAYAVNAPPSIDIQRQMAELFPEWMRAFDLSTPLLEEGRTHVSAAQVDDDAVDIRRLLAELKAQGQTQVLDIECKGEVWGISIDQSVTQALRMAAMYDLYLELRVQNAPSPEEARPRSRFHLDPAWILLGLAGVTVASHAAGEVLRAHQRAKAKSKDGDQTEDGARGKGKMSVQELSKLIREREG